MHAVLAVACTTVASRYPPHDVRRSRSRIAPPQEPFAAAETTRRAALQTTAASIAFAALPAIAKRAPEEQLVWIPVASDVASKPQLAFAQVEKRYGLRFVEYLARILLNYDPASRRWWEARRREAAGASSSDREQKAPAGLFFLRGFVELSLARGYLGRTPAAANCLTLCRPMSSENHCG